MHRAQISNTQHEKKYRRAVRDHRGEPQQHVGIDGIEAAEPGDAVDGRRAVAVFPFDLLVQHLGAEGVKGAELALGEHLFLLVVFHIGTEGGQHEHSDMTGIVPGDHQVISGESAFTDRIVVGRFLGKIIDVAERERRG